MKIAVRLDDITPDMDWNRFLKFKGLLDLYQVKPLIGVVPDNRDENLIRERINQTSPCVPTDFWEYIKRLQTEGWVVAMHGYRHLYTTDKGGIFPLNNFSEFAGLSFDQQKEMLADGKRMLQEKGIETDIFMAPAHSYDRNTLKALKATGFKALTDGYGNKPYQWQGLIFYPISFKLNRTLKKKKGYSTMVIHTDTISEKDFKRYEGYFQEKDTQWVSYEEYLRQPFTKRTCLGRGMEFLMASGKAMVSKLLFHSS